MARRFAPFAFVAALAGLAVAVPRLPAAPPGGDEQQLVADVNKAIARGVNFLRQQQQGDNWEGILFAEVADMKGGTTALVTLALLNCGLKPDEPVVRRGLDFLRRLPAERTYVVSLTTMALAEARQPADLGLIQRNIDWLLETAVKNRSKIAGWSYPRERADIPDASNTQFALLGLYAGKSAGAKIDDAVWRQVRDLYKSTQSVAGNTGFWQYDYLTNGPLSGPSFSMTVAGVCGLLIARMGLNETEQRLNVDTGAAANCGVYDTTDPVNKGVNWVAENFKFVGAAKQKSVYYNIYSIERIGRLSGLRFLGTHDWYRRGCKFLLGEQSPSDGSWSGRGGGAADPFKTLATSFALLFLSKGKTPILINKLAYGDHRTDRSGVLVEQGTPANVVGWNRKQHDARNLTDYASRELFNGLPLAWQVYDPRRVSLGTNAEVLGEVGVLLASPIVYLNGHDKPVLSDAQKDVLKRYVEEGGFILAEACCGSEAFARGFRDLMAELFPNSPLGPVPPSHPLWTAHAAVSPADFPGLECLEMGCKTVVVFSPKPLAGYWEETRFVPQKGKPAKNKGERAFRLAGNVIAYATGMQPPDQRGTERFVLDTSKIDIAPPRGAFKPAQLRTKDETFPAQAAMRNLMAYVQGVARVEVVLDKQEVWPADPQLFKYKFLYLHGRKRVAFADEEAENVKMALESGGTLLADACCGKKEFDESFRELVEKKLFPGKKLELIPAEDEIYSEKLNGTAIRTVKRREKAGGEGPDAGFKDLPPHLEGIKIDGRWAVIYSKYDLGCSIEGHKSTDCLGHAKESALRLGTAAVLYSLRR